MLGLCFLLVVDGDRLLGGVALQEGRRLGLPCFRMLGAGPLCPDHLDLLAVQGEEDVVGRLVGDWLRRPGARLFDLEGIRTDSRLFTVLPNHVRREFLAVAPWVALPADFEDYLAARSANFRRNLRRASASSGGGRRDLSHRARRGGGSVPWILSTAP